MTGKDGLAVVARLRLQARREAEAGFAAAVRARHAAALRVGQLGAQIATEDSATMPRTYGDWLARCLAEREEARASETAAAQQEAAALQRLVEARRDERVIELLRERRAAAARRRAVRRETMTLDENAARAARGLRSLS